MRITQLVAGNPWLIAPDAVRPLLEIAERVDRLDRPSLEPMVDRLQALSARSGAPIDGARSARLQGDGVAVIPIHGPIIRHAGMFDDVCGITSVDSIERDLKAALASPAVRSIVLHVDSPGGMAADIGELAETIRAADATKPVRSYVGNQAASAAMWLAAGAREIVASNTAILGSVGVVLTGRDTRKRDEREGIERIEIISSISPGKRPDPTTDEGRAQLQAMVDRLGEEFIGALARLRGVEVDRAKERFGKGGQLVGRDAVEAGLADRIGSFDALVRECGAKESKGTGAIMPTESKNVAATETPEQIEARVRRELEATIRAEAQDQIKAERKIAIDARVEASLARLSGKLTPGLSESVAPLLRTLAEDDADDGGTRFKSLEGVLAGLPESGLVREVVPADRKHKADDADAKDDFADLDAQTEAFCKGR